MMTFQTETSSPHYILGVMDDVSPNDLIATGDRMGFYSALNMLGSLTSDEMAEFTGEDERYVHDWLHHEATLGHITYSERFRRFFMTPEQTQELARLGARIEPRC